MPHLTIINFAMIIRKKDHNVPILLMTAYDDITSEHSILEDLHIAECESIAVKISPFRINSICLSD